MNKNKGMIEYKEDFITKIKKFFKNLFGKKEEIYSNIEDNIVEKEITENTALQNNFFEDLKVDSTDGDKVINKKNFLEELDGNVEALNLLSTDRLIKLQKYYDNVIKENEEKIKKIKKIKANA